MTEMEKLENVIRARFAYDSAFAAGRAAGDLHAELINALDEYGQWGNPPEGARQELDRAIGESHMQQAYAARLEEHQQYIKNERGEQR